MTNKMMIIICFSHNLLTYFSLFEQKTRRWCTSFSENVVAMKGIHSTLSFLLKWTVWVEGVHSSPHTKWRLPTNSQHRVKWKEVSVKLMWNKPRSNFPLCVKHRPQPLYAKVRPQIETNVKCEMDCEKKISQITLFRQVNCLSTESQASKNQNKSQTT